MQRFSITRLVVLSPKKRTSRAINFHPKATILTGRNHTGKSSMIKSLMSAFGTEPQMTEDWKAEATHILVGFTVDGVLYHILREGDCFTVFCKGQVKGVFRSVTNGLGPWIAELMRFEVKLTSRSGETLTPPPAFLLLPYYFDQDTSWNKSWNGFRQLAQFSKWQRDLIEYHIGLKPNEYYTTKGEQLKLKAEQVAAQQKVAALKGIRDQIKEEYKEVIFAVDLEAFQEEVKELLVACSRLQKEAEKIKQRLVGYYGEKIELESQIEIVGASLKELNKDFAFLVEQHDTLECPICGTNHERRFSDVFGIAKDEGKMEALLHELGEELNVVVASIGEMEGSHRKFETDIANIKMLLERKQTEVQLKDLIDAEGKRKLKSLLQSKFDESQTNIFATVEKIADLQKLLDGFVSKERRKAIRDAYHQAMRRNLFELGVDGVSRKVADDYMASALSQGSDQPRLLLAYGFAILEVMHQREGSSVFCPVVIDSPVQQEQDERNHLRIVEFIKKRMSTDGQLIMGIVDDKGVDFGGTVVRMTGSRAVLQSEGYEDLYAEVFPFIRASLAFESEANLL